MFNVKIYLHKSRPTFTEIVRNSCHIRLKGRKKFGEMTEKYLFVAMCHISVKLSTVHRLPWRWRCTYVDNFTEKTDSSKKPNRIGTVHVCLFTFQQDLQDTVQVVILKL